MVRKTDSQPNKWFQPAIYVINQLKYPQKFALISCLFLMPLSLAIYLLLSEIQQKIDFTKSETQGLQYLRILRELNEKLLIYQAQIYSVSSQKITQSNDQLKKTWRSLQTVEKNFGQTFKTQAQFVELNEALEKCQQKTCYLGDKYSHFTLQKIHQKIYALWNQIGDQSNLILDPDLDSYYLMDAILLKLPNIQNDLAELQKISHSFTSTKTLNEQERNQFIILRENLTQTNQHLVNSMGIAFEYNPTAKFRPHLRQKLLYFSQQIATLTHKIDTLVNTTQPINLVSIHPQTSKNIEESFRLWDDTSSALMSLLQNRIQGFRLRQWSLGLFVLLTLAIAAYLFVGFYLSVMQMVASLRAASYRMIAGKQAESLILPSRDEMTEVIDSFNTIADALKAAEIKYRSIFENAVEGIYQTTIEGDYLTVNPMLARLYGYDSPQHLITHLTDIDHQLYVDRDRRQEFINLIEKKGKIWNFESEIYHKDGGKLWISESARAIYNSIGKIIGFEGTVINITRRKQDELEIIRLTEQLQHENLRMGAELKIAHRLQQMLMPSESELNAVVDLDIAGFMEPATEVGGDYYDILQYSGKVQISMGDVTGHGLESSIVMIMAQTAVRALIANGETNPARLLNAVNQTIYANTQRMGSYKNMSLVLLEYEAGKIRLSGQHEELIIVRQNGEIEQIDTLDLGFPLGLEFNIFDFVSEQQIQLHWGDIAVLYTDGITEAMNLDKQQYGLSQLCQILQANRDRTATEIRQAVIENLKQFIDTQKVFDDITLLVLKQR